MLSPIVKAKFQNYAHADFAQLEQEAFARRFSANLLCKLEAVEKYCKQNETMKTSKDTIITNNLTTVYRN